MAFLGADFFRGDFFRQLFSPNNVLLCQKYFSSHLAIMATGSANPEVCDLGLKVMHGGGDGTE